MTMTDTNLHAIDFKVTARAANRIAAIASGEPENKLFRVSVEGGGCSGFQYKFDMVREPQGDDIVIEKGSATVLVDKMSLDYIAGSEIDYVDDLMGASFRVKNPKAQASCGCGTSFSI